MTRDEIKQEIKSRYREYFSPAKKKGTYICPLCGNGKGESGTGLEILPRGDGTQLHCFKCGKTGDIIDFYMEEHNCSYNDALQALSLQFSIKNEGKIMSSKKTDKKATPSSLENDLFSTQTEEPAKEYMQYYNACRTAFPQSEGETYCKSRGLSEATIKKFGIGFDAKDKAVVIPVSSYFYIARLIGGRSLRYNNPKGAAVELFNIKTLESKPREEQSLPLFIVEGTFDALSIIEAGGDAIALNSTSNARLFIEKLEKKKTERPIILYLDNDKEGKSKTVEISQKLKALNIAYKVMNDITDKATGKPYKDANEALVKDREAFITSIEAVMNETHKLDNTRDYIANLMESEIAALKKDAERKTGFPLFDEKAGGIFSGLYSLGGVSSLGKTTFALQLADQIAERGQDVLFFSMEQSRLEIVSKSFARYSRLLDTQTCFTSLQARTEGTAAEPVRKAAEYYCNKVSDRMSVIEGNLDCTVSFIGNYVENYIRENKVKPIVFIDYLQVLRGDIDKDTGKRITEPRQIVDYNVTALKRLSRSLNIPVFVVSSVNRSNYLAPIDFESFKESGGIEYTSDVVLGLQFAIVDEDGFEGKGIKEKRTALREAKAATIRKIELVCLKNRYGRGGWKISYDYHPAFDMFKETGAEDVKPDEDKTDERKADIR